MDKTPTNGAYIYTVDFDNKQHIIKLVDDIRILPLSVIEDIAAFNMLTYLKSGQRMKRKLIIVNDVKEITMNFIQQRYYNKVLDKAKETGWEVISNRFEDGNVEIKIQCSFKHVREIKPYKFIRKPGCSTCSKVCSIVSEARFKLRISQEGGIVIGKYVDHKTRIECICPKHHRCFPTPKNFERTDRSSWMCTECSGFSSTVAERNFREFIVLNGGIFKGNYVDCRTSVECVCSEGHVCYPKLENVTRSGIFCSYCPSKRSSFGEKLVMDALNNMNINYDKEYHHPLIPGLRFDFCFMYKEKTYYIEYDGEQHFKEVPFFHTKESSFYKSRQRDLLKNYIINLDINSVLIRIDYRWSRTKNILKRQSLIDKMVKYIKNCIQSEGKIFANNLIYTWLNDPLSKETLERYYNGTLDDLLFDDFDIDEFVYESDQRGELDIGI